MCTVDYKMDVKYIYMYISLFMSYAIRVVEIIMTVRSYVIMNEFSHVVHSIVYVSQKVMVMFCTIRQKCK